MELMKHTGSSSVPTLATNMSSLSRPIDSEAMRRSSSIWSLFSPASSPKTFHTKSPKAVIDWQLSKPEIITVSRLNIHYTSLRDLMLLQCDCSSTAGVSESSPRAKMKNHLLEQVARAYMPLNMEKHHNKSTQFFPWNWQKLMSCTPLISFPAAGSGWFSGFNLSSALRYLVGRSTRQPVRFLKHRIC